MANREKMLRKKTLHIYDIFSVDGNILKEMPVRDHSCLVAGPQGHILRRQVQSAEGQGVFAPNCYQTQIDR